MELRQLRYFIKAAGLSNFTEASNQLFITQSTLSQQIKTLEDELGIPLFDRVGKRVRLTEAGHLFLPHAQKVVRDANDGRQALKDLADMQTGTLTIGATYGLTDLLTKAVLSFNAQYPQIKLQIGFGTTAELRQKLDAGSLDLMLSFLPGGEALFSARLSLIGLKTDPVMAKKILPLKALPALSLLLPSKGYSIRNLLDEKLANQHIEVKPEMEINDIHTLLKLVESGRWYTILMNTTLFANHPALTALPLEGREMERAATVIWPEDSYRKKSALLFVESLKDEAGTP